ncbi:hypothetical protein IJJ97_04215 [bacterium]|nr:hypothetical protein [bacterium]
MSATEPLDSGEVFSELCPSMREYLESAKKLSKQHKHFFLGQEHFLGAFLLNSNSVIRKYIDQPKWNAKKKVQSLLQKAYPQAKNGAKWNGFIVTPRMQDTWSDAVQLTQFGEPTDVHEVHILDSMFTKLNRPIKKWLQSENLDDEKELMSFFERELEEFKNSSHEEDFVQQQPAKSSNPFAIFNIFKPKEKNIEIKVHDSYAQTNDSYEENNSYDNNYSENNYDNNYSEPVPSEDIPQQEESFDEQQQQIEPVQQEVKEKSADKNRVLRVGDSYTYQESELVARGMPASIIDAFMQLADEYGPLPERILFNKRKVYFENLLYENLTLEEYQIVVADLEDSIKAAISRSPFRSSSTATPSTHSLFNRKTPEETKTEEAPPVYTPVMEDTVVEEPVAEESSVPTFDNSVPAYTPVMEDTVVEEPAVEESSAPTAFDNSVPAYTPVMEDTVVEEPAVEESSVPTFDNSVPAYTPVEETVEDTSVMTPIRPDNEETFSAEDSVEEVTVDIDDVSEENAQKQEEQKVVEKTEEVQSEVSEESSVAEEEIEDEQELEDIVSNVRYVKGASPSAIYQKYMEHTDISSMLKDSKSLYLTKDIENLQEGFHWSEMLDFVPVNSVSPTPKLGKVDLEMITVGILEKKS